MPQIKLSKGKKERKMKVETVKYRNVLYNIFCSIVCTYYVFMQINRIERVTRLNYNEM